MVTGRNCNGNTVAVVGSHMLKQKIGLEQRKRRAKIMDVPEDKVSTALCLMKTGQRHIGDNMDCEDACVTVEKSGFKFYGLADGQSGKRFGKLGGEAVLRAIAHFLEETTIQAMLQYEYIDELQYELTRVIRDALSNLSKEYTAAKEEFSSTVIAIAIDPNTNEYIRLHLGDGAILAVKKDSTPVVISMPDNGITRQYTWLTTSQSAMMHLRIQKATADHTDRLILLTDGATMFFRNGNIARSAKSILCDCDNTDSIVAVFEKSNPQDDASCIVIDFKTSD